MDQRPLGGSERAPLPGAQAVGRTHPDERLEVTVVIRRRDAEGLKTRVRDLAERAPAPRHLDPAAFETAYGATPADIAKVTAFAKTHGLAVVETHAGRCTVILSGTVAQFEQAFGVALQDYDYAGGSYRGRTGPVHVPAELMDVVEAVMGLDNRPAAQPHFRIRAETAARGARLAAAATSFTPPQLAALYGFPKGDGAGQCIALIELGGGYRPADLAAYFAGLGIAAPTVSAVRVDHAANKPVGDPNSADGEVLLDIEVAGAVAPGAHIVVYFAPNTDAGFLNAITTAAHDQQNRPSIISISWGGAESAWSAQALASFDSAFQAAAVLGITVLAASGDNGSSDGVSDGQSHVDFPASSPHVTGCGGTRVQASGGALGGETVWNDGDGGGAGGGGVSAVFPLPAWQQGLVATPTAGRATPLSNRGVPDVAGDADPQSGYEIRVDGATAVFGGTSAVAPLWAGLIAVINANGGRRAGFINPPLYRSPNALRDVAVGDNGAFAAGRGWDACTGLGSPDGAAVTAALAAVTPAAAAG